jgi:pyruvate dehydrogenase complex dehydrogenase (E1) component
MLAQAMREAFADRTLRERIVVEGPQWTRRFSMESMARQYAEVYHRAAGSQ